MPCRRKRGGRGGLATAEASAQDWAEQVADPVLQNIVDRSYHLPAYTLLNGRIGYRFLKNQAELSVMAFNILGNEHREHPMGQIVGRRVMGNFTYKF